MAGFAALYAGICDLLFCSRKSARGHALSGEEFGNLQRTTGFIFNLKWSYLRRFEIFERHSGRSRKRGHIYVHGPRGFGPVQCLLRLKLGGHCFGNFLDDEWLVPGHGLSALRAPDGQLVSAQTICH
jgi:hypothetical protein